MKLEYCPNFMTANFPFYSASFQKYPPCVFDEDILDGRILRLGNSSAANHRFLSCVKNADKQVNSGLGIVFSTVTQVGGRDYLFELWRVLEDFLQEQR
jgi:hypothetical protein